MADQNNNAAPLTLDFTKAQPLAEQSQSASTGNQSASTPVTLDFNKAQGMDENSVPYSDAFSRYTTPENYQNWLKTPPKAGPNSKPGEYEAWSGAHTPGGAKETLENAGKTVAEGGLVATTALGGAAALEALPSVVPSTIEGVKAIGAWAKANPLHAYVLLQVMKDVIPGAKKALGIIKAAPIGE